MKIIAAITAGIVIGVLAFAGASFAAEKPGVTSEDVKRDAAKTVEAAKAYAEQQKQEYSKQIQSKIDDLSKRIDELKLKGKDARGEALTRMESALSTLKAKQEEVQKQLKEVGSATSAAWSDARKGLDKAVGELQRAYEDATKHFK